MIRLFPQQARALQRQARMTRFQKVAHRVRALRPLWLRLSAPQKRKLLDRLKGTTR
jgi:hypothetical protein